MQGSVLENIKHLEAQADQLIGLCEGMPVNEPSGTLDYIRTIVSALADNGRALAYATRVLREEKAAALALVKIDEPKAGATEIKVYVEGRCSYIMYVVDLLEETGNVLSKALDGARTAISYAKTELNNISYMEG